MSVRNQWPEFENSVFQHLLRNSEKPVKAVAEIIHRAKKSVFTDYVAKTKELLDEQRQQLFDMAYIVETGCAMHAIHYQTNVIEIVDKKTNGMNSSLGNLVTICS